MLGEANRLSVALTFSGQGRYTHTHGSPQELPVMWKSKQARWGLRETEAPGQPSRKGDAHYSRLATLGIVQTH